MAIDPARPLRLNTHNAMIAGVCAGVADYIGWDHTLVRVLVALLTLATGIGPGVIAYIVLWIIIPPAGVDESGEQPPSSDEGNRGSGI